MTIGVHDWDYCTLLWLGHDISSRAWTVVVIVLGRCHMPDNSSSDKFTPFLSFLCYKTYCFPQYSLKRSLKRSLLFTIVHSDDGAIVLYPYHLSFCHRNRERAAHDEGLKFFLGSAFFDMLVQKSGKKNQLCS